MRGKSREAWECRIKRENSMRVIASALLLLLSTGAAVAAEAPGTITEFALDWPGGVRHSTHELAAYENNGGGFWVTGQNQDQIARVKLDGTPEYFAVRNCREGRRDAALARRQTADQSLATRHRFRTRRQDDLVHRKADRHDRQDRPRRHRVTHFALNTVGSVPIYLEAGPDGNMWGTELVGNMILRVKPGGEITEFPIPTQNSRPIAIVRGPDASSMWFSEEAGNKVARIDREGKITEYPIPQAGKSVIPAGLAFDRDGKSVDADVRGPEELLRRH
jgi:virginiamycin B lyase